MEREHIPNTPKKIVDTRVEYNTSETKFEGRYKPGGAVTAALGNWSHRVFDSGSDATGCGRWSHITYGGKGDKRLTYILVYRVCNQKDRVDTTAWKQQHNIKYADINRPKSIWRTSSTS
jgi:hypothetical protein